MGLTKNQGNGKYVRFKGGKFYFASELKEKGEQAEAYDTLEGQLVDIGLRDDEFEGNVIEKLSLTIQSEGTNYIVNVPFTSVYASQFLSFLMNADVTKPIGIKGVSKKETGSNGEQYDKVSMLVYQRDENGNETYMKSYFTKADPKGMPEMVQKELNGKKVWDKTEKLKFERKLILDTIKPKLAGVSSSIPETVNMDDSPVNDAEDVDLPF